MEFLAMIGATFSITVSLSIVIGGFMLMVSWYKRYLRWWMAGYREETWYDRNAEHGGRYRQRWVKEDPQ